MDFFRETGTEPAVICSSIKKVKKTTKHSAEAELCLSS